MFLSVDCIQLGFLSRNVAKWVSPLWDCGFFKFSGYVCPKEVLAAALGESCNKVQLILNVSEVCWIFGCVFYRMNCYVPYICYMIYVTLQGHRFKDMSKMMQPEQIVAFCSLIASIQRCYGLWRLQEINGARPGSSFCIDCVKMFHTS